MKRCFVAVLLMTGYTAILQAQTVTGTFVNAVNGSDAGIGTLSLFDLVSSQWIFTQEPSGVSAPLNPVREYRAYTDQDRFTYQNALRKHHQWDGEPKEFQLSTMFGPPPGEDEFMKRADFVIARKTTLFHNFEEFTDEGSVRFRDPWYVNANQEQTGDFESFASPHVPTGAYGEVDPAVLLGKVVEASFPFYSLKFHRFLQSDYETPANAPLTGDDWVFIGAYAREAGDVDMWIGLV